ncbi:methyltransferase domain-containing protein [Xylanimonas protaetiae]|uniref:Methyltransferase domain-containing protein n=1 Tax=Xylanimonas protaetiae TaxID=2509457 RepID=A0A4V0YFR9_9MICO|nr:methyltransferase domain-containing protein [Xylanimonas protaetiae]QAY68671.1 methyltransferase domain-containing protein [Xylanimonas protaetiae]
MDSCCEPQGYDRVFTAGVARRDAARYRRSGLTRDPQRVVDLYRAGEVRGETVLDVGAGIGDLGLELLRAGASHVTAVDLSPGYDDVAASLAAQAGLSARVSRATGDLAARPGLAEPADVVALMKVVCCYADPGRLLAVAAGAARRHVVLSYPRDTWWLRLFARGSALAGRWRRTSWRFAVHPERDLLAVLEREGLTVTRRERAGVFTLVVTTRA